MLFRILYIIVIAFIIMGNAMHPVHVTVTNIDFNPKQKAFNISTKLFLDDFQGVILKNSKVELNLGKPNVLLNADEYINDYISDNIKITINKTTMQPPTITGVQLYVSLGFG